MQNHRSPKLYLFGPKVSYKSSGTQPVRRLPLSPRDAKLDRLPNSGGSSPLSRLSSRYRRVRFTRLPSFEGTSSVN